MSGSSIIRKLLTKIQQMKNAPYSFCDAENIAREYGHLVGQPFGSERKYIIDCVVVTPFDELNKSRFLQMYMLCGDSVDALSGDYLGLLFDILVIGRAIDDEMDLVQERLSTWLGANSCTRFIRSERQQQLNIAV